MTARSSNPSVEQPTTVVVGAGLFGLATAVHLARAGRRVTVVESGTAAGATTAAGAGFVGLWAAGYAWYWNESELALEQEGLDFYRSVDAAGYDIALRNTGNIWLALTEQAVLDHLLPFAEHPLRPDGARLLTAAETAELVPGLDADAIVGAFVHPDGIQISAPDAGAALVALARAEGVEIIEQTPVVDVLVEGGRAIGVLTGAGDRLLADDVVLAAGSWTNELLAATGRELPFARVIASRLTTESFGLGAIPTLMIPELDGLWVREHRGGLTYGNGVGYEALAVRGGVAERRPERPDLTDAMRAQLSPIITGLFPRAAPVVDAAEAVQGVVSYTADRRFLAGPVPEVVGLYVVAGDNESGVTHGPGLGRMLAELIVDGESTFVDAGRYAPARFPKRPFADEVAVAAAMPARRLVDAVQTDATPPAAALPTHAEVVVIGSGIVGAAAARALAESGREVLLIERFARGHELGSSHGATRIFRQGYDADDYVALTSEALAGWRALEARTGRTLLDLTGALDHGRPDMLDGIEAAMRRGGIASERLSADAAGERWPGLRFDGEVLHHASGGRLHAAEAIEALLDVAQDAGAELRFGVRVTAVEPIPTAADAAEPTDRQAAGAVVRTELGDVVAAHVVVAAGSWTPDLVGALAAGVGRPLPEIVVTQVQPAHFPSALPDDRWPSFVHYPADGSSVYGLLTPGEGVKVGLHGGAVNVHPDERDGLAEPEELSRLTEYVASWVPGVDATAPTTISCLYDLSPSEDFVIDRIGRIIVTTGFSGHGFKFGPVLGRLITDLVDGLPPHPRFALAAHAATALPVAPAAPVAPTAPTVSAATAVTAEGTQHA